MYETFTKDELEKIVASESLEDLKLEFSARNYQTLFSSLNKTYKIKYINSKSHAFVSAINSSAIPIDTFWLITGCIELGILGAAALPVTIGIIAFGLLVGAYFFSETYKNRNRKKTETIEFFQLSHLKLKALDELIQREKNSIALLNYLPACPLEVKKDSMLTQPLSRPSPKKSISLGLTVTTVLGMTFFLGISSFFQTLGYISMVSVLASPIGLGIALGAVAIAIGVGAYLGYKHYQSKKSQHLVQNEKNVLTKQIRAKQKIYDSLVRKRETLELMSTYQHQSTSRNDSLSLSPSNRCSPPQMGNKNLNFSSQHRLFGTHFHASPLPHNEPIAKEHQFAPMI